MIVSTLTGITIAPAQNFSIPLNDGTNVQISLVYRPNQMGWFYNLSWPGSSSYSPLTINGRRVVTSPNMLRQYQNQLSFGFGCTTVDGQEPLNQNSFAINYASLFILDQSAVAATESTFFLGL